MIEVSDFDCNKWNTTDLVLSVMNSVANQLHLNIHDNEIANNLYDICNDLEGWPEDHGFSSSDRNTYINEAKEIYFGISDK